MHNIWVRKLRAEGHLSYSRLRNARVLEFAFLVWLEPVPHQHGEVARLNVYLLLDGKLSNPAIFTLGFVDTAICTAADEAHDLVALADALLVVISGKHDFALSAVEVAYNVNTRIED